MKGYIQTVLGFILLLLFFITLNTINKQSGWYALNAKAVGLYLFQTAIAFVFFVFMSNTKDK